MREGKGVREGQRTGDEAHRDTLLPQVIDVSRAPPCFSGLRFSSRFESSIISHHSRFTCECDKEEINGDDDEFSSDID